MEQISLEDLDKKLLLMESKYLQELLKGTENPELIDTRRKIND